MVHSGRLPVAGTHAARDACVQRLPRLGQRLAKIRRMRTQSPWMVVWAGCRGGRMGAVGSSASRSLSPADTESMLFLLHGHVIDRGHLRLAWRAHGGRGAIYNQSTMYLIACAVTRGSGIAGPLPRHLRAPPASRHQASNSDARLRRSLDAARQTGAQSKPCWGLMREQRRGADMAVGSHRETWLVSAEPIAHIRLVTTPQRSRCLPAAKAKSRVSWRGALGNPPARSRSPADSWRTSKALLRRMCGVHSTQ
jgi:hypothetical protein